MNNPPPFCHTSNPNGSEMTNPIDDLSLEFILMILVPHTSTANLRTRHRYKTGFAGQSQRISPLTWILHFGPKSPNWTNDIWRLSWSEIARSAVFIAEIQKSRWLKAIPRTRRPMGRKNRQAWPTIPWGLFVSLELADRVCFCQHSRRQRYFSARSLSRLMAVSCVGRKELSVNQY